jgi:hypothetical protein
MHHILITESSLRELLKEIMDSSAPVNVNPVVDPQAAETNPTNQNFSPDNKIELMSALRMLVNSVNDEDANDVYVAIKDAIEEKEDEMKKANVEEAIRMTIRKMLTEVNDDDSEDDLPGLPPVTKIPAGQHGSEFMKRFEKSKAGLQKTFSSMRDEDYEQPRADEPAAGRGRKNVMMTDVSGASFKDIAKEMGFAAESGAKQAVEKALSKAKFVMKMDLMDPEQLEIIVLQSMKDYIDVLKNTGELDTAEVKILKDNPGIVRELDGFREFLDKELRKVRKSNEGEE